MNSEGSFSIDTGIFLRNCRDFTARFPEQAASFGLNHPETALRCLRTLPPEYRLVQAKAQGAMPTLAVRGSFLHSRYNPLTEAQRILHSEFFQTQAVANRCIFVGLALGYLVSQYIERFSAAEVVIIEADCNVFTCFLAACPHSSLFSHPRLSILVGTQPEEAVSFLTSTGWDNAVLCKAPASIAAYKSWYEHFFTLLERAAMKDSINAKTLERFGTLWLKNTVKNLEVMCTAAKIHFFRNAFSDATAVVLAGGPSLTEHLKLIKKSDKDFLIIAVDTALRACLHEGITPDFIVSFDPQYWNYLHTAGLDMSKSLLISEVTVFPALLRDRCRALFLAHSSAPFAGLLEGEKDSAVDCTLAAGGSVATTAWDFARYIGAETIIMAGLDLAYPHLQTHFVGSTFEESAHTSSSRLAPAEQAAFKSLYGAFPSLHHDYNGRPVLTDRRMLLYAWWFERTLIKYPEVKTYNLVPKGLRIAGMPACSAQDFALRARGLPRTAIDARISSIVKKAYSPAFFGALSARKQQIASSVKAMAEGAALLAAQAEKAQAICRRLAACREHMQAQHGAFGSAPKHCGEQAYQKSLRCGRAHYCETGNSSTNEYAALTSQLDRISEEIKNGFAKDVVDVLFFKAPNSASEVNSGADPYVEAEKVYKRIQCMAVKTYELFLLMT